LLFDEIVRGHGVKSQQQQEVGHTTDSSSYEGISQHNPMQRTTVSASQQKEHFVHINSRSQVTTDAALGFLKKKNHQVIQYFVP